MAALAFFRRPLAMQRPHRLLLAALAAATLSACTTHYSLSGFDRLARTGPARTIVLEEGFSLYSPYDIHTTREYVTLITAQQAEVFALLGVASPEPIVVQLRETEGIGADFSVEGDRMSVDRIAMEPHDGVLGWAGEEVVVRVAPERKIRLEDGREISGMLGASMYAATLRHELAHVAVQLTGIRRQAWLSEGMAHAIEWLPVEEGRFVLDPVPPNLAAAARLARAPGELARLLAWEQAYPATDADRHARLMALSLVLFLLEREAAPSLGEGLRRIDALGHAELLALEPAWSTWLARIARSAPAPAE